MIKNLYPNDRVILQVSDDSSNSIETLTPTDFEYMKAQVKRYQIESIRVRQTHTNQYEMILSFRQKLKWKTIEIWQNPNVQQKDKLILRDTNNHPYTGTYYHVHLELINITNCRQLSQRCVKKLLSENYATRIIGLETLR